MNNATQLTLSKQPEVLTKEQREINKYKGFIGLLKYYLNEVRPMPLDIVFHSTSNQISATCTYYAIRALLAEGYLIQDGKDINKHRLFRLASKIGGPPDAEWLYRQVRQRVFDTNEKSRKRTEPEPEPTPQPTNYGLLWSDGSTNWFTSMDAAKEKGYAELSTMPDLKSVTIIQKVARLNASITVLAEQL